MLFNSLNFALFLPIVFVLYWFVFHKKLKAQNCLLLCTSYFFYACWDWRFLILLLISTGLVYLTGIKIANCKNKSTKKFWFLFTIIISIGILGVFKYFNFFAASFAQAFSSFGYEVNPLTLQVILPIGISFYTFHGLSYMIDLYKERIKPERNFTNYAVFVSFFPLLVAGPIERATHLLPQIQKKRLFNPAKAIDGLRQILWGLFKKVVIADQCATYANLCFNHPNDYSGSMLLLGAIFFAFQIYCDFSGYSDIALGTSRLFGIELLRNFAFPYFSRDIAEFWRRWHISLSTWFRDYVYFPLGGSRGNIWMKIRNTFIIFLLSGFWHGANTTYIAWGAINALYFIPLLLLNKNRQHLEIVAQGKTLPSLREFIQMGFTFFITVMAWVFFRADSLQAAYYYFNQMISASLFSLPTVVPKTTILFLTILLLIEWIGREQTHALATFGANWNRMIRLLFYFAIVVSIFYFTGNSQQFIYFQF